MSVARAQQRQENQFHPFKVVRAQRSILLSSTKLDLGRRGMVDSTPRPLSVHLLISPLDWRSFALRTLGSRRRSRARSGLSTAPRVEGAGFLALGRRQDAGLLFFLRRLVNLHLQLGLGVFLRARTRRTTGGRRSHVAEALVDGSNDVRFIVKGLVARSTRKRDFDVGDCLFVGFFSSSRFTCTTLLLVWEKKTWLDGRTRQASAWVGSRLTLHLALDVLLVDRVRFRVSVGVGARVGFFEAAEDFLSTAELSVSYMILEEGY